MPFDDSVTPLVITMGGGFDVMMRVAIWNGRPHHYVELLFIHSGQFLLKAGDEIFHARAGDTLWIPRDTPFTYLAEVDVWFFFAVHHF